MNLNTASLGFLDLGMAGVKQEISEAILRKEPGANASLNAFQDITDPKYIGPGTWFIIHKKAFAAQTRSEQEKFIVFMNDTCTNFGCKKCSGHCLIYISKHPMEEYLGVDVILDKSLGGDASSSSKESSPAPQRVMLGMFLWTWKFHNTINALLNKPLMSWDTALNLFSPGNSLVCSSSCEEAIGVESSSKAAVVSSNPLPSSNPSIRSAKITPATVQLPTLPGQGVSVSTYLPVPVLRPAIGQRQSSSASAANLSPFTPTSLSAQFRVIPPY